MSLENIRTRIGALSVMRKLGEDAVIATLCDLLQENKAEAYGAFVAALYDNGTDNLSQYVKKIVFESENVYVKAVGKGETPSLVLENSLREDLKTFDMVAALKPSDFNMGELDFLPQWETCKTHLEREYFDRIKDIGKIGYGIYAKYHMFCLNEHNAITPVYNPDNISLSDLVDYEREKNIIIENTRALLSGKPAANILLTGDAGTGKSSTVKAVVNEMYSQGLRIIEVRKSQLYAIPEILDGLTENPLKFILFIDDLSFAKDDANFSALKAMLEGSVSAKSQNVVIYATSNRRHLVKETFTDREGDDVHFNDTMQEILSLSERFGIQLTFNRPDKATYLNIVHNLADKQGILYDAEKLDILAERFALKRGTRSARAAKQFVDGIVAGNSK